VTGVLAPANGGTGIDSSGTTGCPRVAGGVWTINTANCGGSTPFSITGFSGGSTVEVGTSIANPTFTASYSSAPASAQITNTENIDSPLVLSTPFTSGTVSGTFVHTSATTTTFTLSATQGTTLTATQQISWQPAIFGGVGANGATSSVTASGTTAVLSTGDALARLQLGAEQVNQTFGPFSPSSQVIYLLLTGGSHTFIDANTGFAMAFNAPITVSFVNAQGVTVTMYLYATTYPQNLPYTIKVAS
jgi:hypothetical protein